VTHDELGTVGLMQGSDRKTSPPMCHCRRFPGQDFGPDTTLRKEGKKNRNKGAGQEKGDEEKEKERTKTEGESKVKWTELMHALNAIWGLHGISVSVVQVALSVHTAR